MKERELKVLHHLRLDARKQFTQISRETGIPTTTVFDYYQRLREEFITRHVSLLDFASLGYHFNSFFLVECFRTERLLEYLKSDKRINNVFELEDNTLLFEAVFRDAEEQNSFKQSLESFNPRNVEALPVVKDIKREEFLPRGV